MDNQEKRHKLSIDQANQMLHMVGYMQGEDGEALNYLPPKAADSVDKILSFIQASDVAIKTNKKLFGTEKINYKYYKLDKEVGEYRANKCFAPPRPEDYLFRSSPQGKTICCALRALRDPEFRKFLEDIHPGVEISKFTQVADESGIVEVLWSHQNVKPLDAKSLAEKLNDFVDKFRTAAKEKDFKKAVNSSTRRVSKNRRSVENLLAWGFERYARLLVIRLDLGYRKPEGMEVGEFARHISEERAKKDLEVFLKRNAPHGLFTHMVGYVVKMEMAPHKGLHFHVLMLFDGRHHREDITIAATLGRYWVEITGDGLFFNCNQKWHGKPQCAVGMIHRDDQEKRTALKERVVPYLTKMDRYFQFLPKLTDRTLRRSQIRRVSPSKGSNGSAGAV
ncbi:inovirus-type Gp2 protein [Chromobacterium violaceum]|uniref:YagK/YfjJ domain-containing protein n=1 Tax=Chromobacterium violaceum TaxID=536 RepID=UPI001BEB8A76|nr:inovirus-type Gp2 protein [Chromobacterium violaceum]MBT2866319.1 inovirus-type Gp2 protein [Chromobacterium violaceum]